MRVISANVNGIRAAARRGGLDWLSAKQPDLLALQEVRADAEQCAAALRRSAFRDWSVSLRCGPVPGRAGVAVLTPERPTEVRGGEVLRFTAGEGDGGDGRWIEVDTGTGAAATTVVSCYVHTGEAGTPKQQQKYGFLDAISTRLAEQAATGRHVVVTGDLNICHRQVDLRNWKGNRGKSGFLPREQDYLTGWLDAGWVDVVRADAGEVDGPYTWWSWRGKAFDNDTGWRIDYQLATHGLAALAREVRTGRATSYAERWSDHAAVMVDYALPTGAAGAASAAG